MTTRSTNHKDDDKSSVAPNHFREIRSIHTKDTIRVYQAYNDQIADAAVAANSFRAPLEAGIWSKNRMTWIKPSKVWMAYRCGWTMLKDKNQSRVLALDLSRSYFESLLRKATVTHLGCGKKRNVKKKKCRDSDVVVQWDPERIMDVDAHGKQSFTSPIQSVRSIQVGLRGSAVEALLDEKSVLQITDVTQGFRNALKALKAGDLEEAESLLFPHNMGKECIMNVPDDIQRTLCMDMDDDENDDTQTEEKVQEKTAIVVLGSAANPPHMGHFHCLQAGTEKAEELGYRVLFATLAIAPYGYVKKKMDKSQLEAEREMMVLSDLSRLQALQLLASNVTADNSSYDFSSNFSVFKLPPKCFGSALECGRKMRPSDDVTVIVIVGGDRSKMKWRKPPKHDQVTICCARDEDQLEELRDLFSNDEKEGLVLDNQYYFATGIGPNTSSTLVRSILQGNYDLEEKTSELIRHGYSKEAALFLCDESKNAG